MKKSFRKTTFLSTLAIAVPAMGMAQDKVEASVGADLVSGYIWRGQDLGGVSIQPTLSVSYKGFSLSAWGTTGIEKEDTKEIDLTLGSALPAALRTLKTQSASLSAQTAAAH